ncbi:MAG: NAD(P)/FAD-dependent oxidoreductase, partial [Gammaproteobacteria bacterium]|nr:NAD(P)/FAD-dependent oxidoreductase [Gammaproteobacteria bacterium]
DIGVLIDRHMQTNLKHIYAAGDVAQGYDFSTEQQDVHAIQPTATEHGRIAAMNMAGIEVEYQGSLSMNVLDSIGLISTSMGHWMGVEGGDACEQIDEAGHKYLRLEFKDDVLVGATALGLTQHVGILRGMIQSQQPLGEWKQRLVDDPSRIAEAYIGATQAVV